ncbi:MAG: c-type cytochrome [Sideroxydans sp.]|nr:c-type cytochrome [Sideroxydans sp.]
MKRGEKVVLGIIAVVVLILMARNFWSIETTKVKDRGIPYYSTATPEQARDAMVIYDQNNCKKCHSLWTVKDLMESVPAPILDGIGSLHDEEWFYRYFSAADPQSIVPSRLKKEWRMPSYQQLPEHDRHVLASYMASLKVKDWYLEETRKAEYEKLTGKAYKP